jgi:hypothetical protein
MRADSDEQEVLQGPMIYAVLWIKTNSSGYRLGGLSLRQSHPDNMEFAGFWAAFLWPFPVLVRKPGQQPRY